jgi:hypothetical protein
MNHPLIGINDRISFWLKEENESEGKLGNYWGWDSTIGNWQ